MLLRTHFGNKGHVLFAGKSEDVDNYTKSPYNCIEIVRADCMAY